MKNNLLFRFGVFASLAFSSLLSANLDNGTYIIKSMHSGECLEIDSSVNNSKLIQSKCVADKQTQKFTISNIKNNTYTISSLAVGNGSLENGVHYFNSSNGDEFILVDETTDNSFSIKSTISKKVVTLIPYTDEVIQYYDHGGKEQHWRFVDENASNPNSYSSCKEILDNGYSIGDGVYAINVYGESSKVYCDMTTDGGGWTLVVQQSKDGKAEDYHKGDSNFNECLLNTNKDCTQLSFQNKNIKGISYMKIVDGQEPIIAKFNSGSLMTWWEMSESIPEQKIQNDYITSYFVSNPQITFKGYGHNATSGGVCQDLLTRWGITYNKHDTHGAFAVSNGNVPCGGRVNAIAVTLVPGIGYGGVSDNEYNHYGFVYIR